MAPEKDRSAHRNSVSSENQPDPARITRVSKRTSRKVVAPPITAIHRDGFTEDHDDVASGSDAPVTAPAPGPAAGKTKKAAAKKAVAKKTTAAGKTAAKKAVKKAVAKKKSAATAETAAKKTAKKSAKKTAKKAAAKTPKKVAKKAAKKSAPKKAAAVAAVPQVPASPPVDAETTESSATDMIKKPTSKAVKKTVKRTLKKSVKAVKSAARKVARSIGAGKGELSSVPANPAAPQVAVMHEPTPQDDSPAAAPVSPPRPAAPQPAGSGKQSASTPQPSAVQTGASNSEPKAPGSKPSETVTPARPPAAPMTPIPSAPDEDADGGSRMVLMVRDPRWLCAYWEIDPAVAARHRVGQLVGAPLLLVRLTRLHPATEIFDYTVYGTARTWYIPIEHGPGVWQAHLGYIGTTGRFVTILTSNEVNTSWLFEPAKFAAPEPCPEPQPATTAQPVHVPSGDDARTVAEAASPPPRSQHTDWAPQAPAEPRMMQPEDPGPSFEGMAVRTAGASEQLVAREQGAQPAEFAPQVPTGGASEAMIMPPAGASEQRPAPAGEAPVTPEAAPAERPFWLQVQTELIVYGATEPSARVTVQGHPIELRPDGTFTLRFALPDGRQLIPVEAERDDGAERRRITPAVDKKTE